MKTTKTMKRTPLFIATLTLLLSGTFGQARAQDPEELLLFSRQNFGLSTARTAGMGGAFASLGADALSLSLNPAGIAMYRQSEASITPGLKIGATNTDYFSSNASINTARNSTTGNLSGLAVVFGGFPTGDQNSFAVGIGMNRLADFNRRSRAVGFAEEWSIADLFAAQLMYGSPIPASGIGSPTGDIYQAFYHYPPGMWSAIMGYQTSLFDPLNGDNTRYTTAGVLSPGVMIMPTREIKSEGAINEYALSAGGNIGSVLYLGATLGIQSIIHDRYTTYTELTQMPDGSYNRGLDNLTYNQYLSQSGLGMNLKVGATVRPTDWLRIGVAYHSPTWIDLGERYGADLTVWDFRYTEIVHGVEQLVPAFSDTPFFEQEYKLRTPSRLVAGLSAVLGQLGIVSVDYERVWYNKMKYTSDGFDDLNGQIAADYRPVNTFRAGIELQPVSSFFVRGGFGWSSSPYRDSPIGRYVQYSGGLGYRTRGFSIDLAYVYGQTTQPAEKLFSLSGVNSDPVTGAPIPNPADYYTLEPVGTAQTKQHNHHAMLTLGIRF